MAGAHGERFFVARRFRHAGSRHLYESVEPGRIRVSDEEGGRSGLFTQRGEWISGDLKIADPFICGWLDHKSGESSFHNPLAGA
jgi:hypothetical protein